MSAPQPSRPHTGPHTQVPNLLQDYIKPWLGLGERACLDYIVRRTYGFQAPGGGRKEWDRISLTQFEHGIQVNRAGEQGYQPLDLGTGLARNPIRKALESLQELNLIEVAWSCSLCLNEIPPRGEGEPVPKAVRCPRCGKTCDRAFQLAPLSPRKLVNFLNGQEQAKHEESVERVKKTEKGQVYQPRVWGWDREYNRPYFTAGEAEEIELEEVDLDEFGVKLWYREMIDKAVADLNATRRKPISDLMIVNHFYKPVLELQAMSEADPSALKRALETTIYDYRAHLRSRNNKPPYTTWHRLARSIVQSDKGLRENLRRLQQEPANELERAERAAHDLLARAATLNEAGDHEAAREVLSDILALSDALAENFDGSMELADAHLTLAFKLGETDYRYVREAVSPFDHMPDWDWPEHLS